MGHRATAELDRRALEIRGGKPSQNGTPEPRPWEPIIELAAGCPPAEFPLDALPRDVAEFVSDVAGATNTPVDYAGSFALAVAAGTTGATLACSIKEGHIQRSSLYLCGVARKGSGKSPALEAVASPVYDEQAQLKRLGNKVEKAFVGDVTAEKLADLMNNNPRGVLTIRDELAAWLMSFNQYKAKGSGSDRQFFLSAWSGAPVSVDRKNKDSEPVFVRFPCLTVVGTIQPSVLDRFRCDADDGFYDRVLFTFPIEPPAIGENWLTVPESRAKRWAEILKTIREVKMTPGNDGPRPYFLHLNEDARERWADWTQSVAEAINAPEFDELLRGPFVKLSGYAARLALVAHAISCAATGAKFETCITGEDMKAGVMLATYFIDHARRAWTASGLDGRLGPVRKVLAWLRSSGKDTVTRRDVWRGLRRAFVSAEDLSAPLKALVDHGYLRYAPSDPNDRKAAVQYEVNPSVANENVSPVATLSPQSPALEV